MPRARRRPTAAASSSSSASSRGSTAFRPPARPRRSFRSLPARFREYSEEIRSVAAAVERGKRRVMMKRLVYLLVFLVAGAALAQPKPPAELKQLEPFVGKWSCKGIVYSGEWGPEHPTVFKIDTHWSLGGQWLYTDYKETKTAKNPHPMVGIGLWSYDTDVKKFVGGWVDNSGMYQTQQSDGWNGDEIVFTGPTHN